MYTGDADYNCNWLGGEVVSEMIGAPGFSSAGYANITTSDGVVHGQVKQSGKIRVRARLSLRTRSPLLPARPGFGNVRTRGQRP